jgi:hypothetical protein
MRDSDLSNIQIAEEEKVMHAGVLMALYLVITLVAQAIGYFAALFIERQYPSIGLPAFLFISLGMLIVGWPIAVRLTLWMLGPEPERPGRRV